MRFAWGNFLQGMPKRRLLRIVLDDMRTACVHGGPGRWVRPSLTWLHEWAMSTGESGPAVSRLAEEYEDALAALDAAN